MKRFLIASLVAVNSSAAFGFEAGQRWSCVTDQGADAYLDVHEVEGDAVSFSWGWMDSETNEMTSLCNKRDALSEQEMVEFCRLLGDEFSEGHVMLRRGCRADKAE